MGPIVTRRQLDDLYRRYNRREMVHPDPLEFLYRWDDVRDREIGGLACACLAYGRVRQILASLEEVFRRLPPPAAAARERPETLGRLLGGFRHRFTPGRDLADLLAAAGELARAYGSLEGCLLAAPGGGRETVLEALGFFAAELSRAAGRPFDGLVPAPGRGSACKRLHLYLRWMARRDDVDPGGWTRVSPARLVVPVDVHMHRVAVRLGLTRRRQADLRTALEITDAFRAIRPDDPVRYDFALTRFGIRGQASLDDELARWGREGAPA